MVTVYKSSPTILDTPETNEIMTCRSRTKQLSFLSISTRVESLEQTRTYSTLDLTNSNTDQDMVQCPNQKI
jgi:hypothetical protein